MNNKFTVSITDVTGSKHYEVHKIAKRFLAFFIIIMPMLITGLVFAIYRLNLRAQQRTTSSL